MCHLCFVMLSFLACSDGLCISFMTRFCLLLPIPAGVDAEFHAKGLLAPGSGGLKESINTLQLGPSLSFFQVMVENF